MTHHRLSSAVITSTSNAQVKYIRSLCAQAKERRRERVFVLEGVRLVRDALQAGAELRLVLYDAEHLSGSDGGRALVRSLIDRSDSYLAAAQAIAAATDTVTPQGVVAVAAWPEVQPGDGVRLVIDMVQDPGNVGTLLRSAEAAGVGAVYCAKGTADIYSPKVVRAAMGAHFRIAIESDLGWDEIGATLVDCAQIYAAESEATMPYYAADWKQPSALIIGSEAHGISQEGLALAGRRIGIPMAGRADSLNAAVAGSIILFEALRQRSRGRT
jgi:TrmH family RNA methyltransferase